MAAMRPPAFFGLGWKQLGSDCALMEPRSRYARTQCRVRATESQEQMPCTTEAPPSTMQPRTKGYVRAYDIMLGFRSARGGTRGAAYLRFGLWRC